MEVTKHYDKYGRRIPASRNDKRPSTISIVLVIAVVVAILLDVARMLTSYDDQEHALPSHQMHVMDCLTLTYTDDEDDPIKVYVITDPDSDIQYLVSDHGGICVREDRDE